MKEVKLTVTPSFEDDRGAIIDLLENENINAVTIVTFKRGAIRGNHYHEHTTQWNYVMSGRIRLVSQVPGEAIKESILEKGEFAVTGPNVRHALVGLEDSSVMVFTKGPRGGKEYESDTFRLAEPLVSRAK
jgi:quercetin dioxygenase-like cupin family protein